jgi:transposase-like protein
MNSKAKMTRYTLKDFQTQFPNDATCLEWLFRRFYPNGTVFCEKCQRETKHHRVVSRPSYSCDYCGHHVHPTANTIFHKSPTALTTWFYAIYLMASTRCGVSAKQIERETGVTYKTAWRMFKQIRSMLEEGVNPLGGPGKGVEADETYMGGKRKNKVGRPMRGDKIKIPVIGIVERKGRVVARAIPDTTAKTLCGTVRTYVLPSSTVFTDELNSYNTVAAGRYYTHHRINHSSKVYVMGNIHTNTIEGFWSLLKTGIRGVYHSIGQGHLQSYLNEYSFRYNRRHDVQPMFTSFLHQIEKVQSVVIPSAEPIQSLVG